MPIRPAIYFLARLFLGLVFVYAGFTKLIDPIENFTGVITEYGVFPYAIVPFMAYTLPWIELIFGTFLILGFQTRLSGWVMAFLSLSFITLILVSHYVLGVPVSDCGCFGTSGIHLTTQQIIYLDAADLVLGVTLGLGKNHRWGIDSWLRGVS